MQQKQQNQNNQQWQQQQQQWQNQQQMQMLQQQDSQQQQLDFFPQDDHQNYLFQNTQYQNKQIFITTQEVTPNSSKLKKEMYQIIFNQFITYKNQVSKNQRLVLYTNLYYLQSKNSLRINNQSYLSLSNINPYNPDLYSIHDFWHQVQQCDFLELVISLENLIITSSSLFDVKFNSLKTLQIICRISTFQFFQILHLPELVKLKFDSCFKYDFRAFRKSNLPNLQIIQVRNLRCKSTFEEFSEFQGKNMKIIQVNESQTENRRLCPGSNGFPKFNVSKQFTIVYNNFITGKRNVNMKLMCQYINQILKRNVNTNLIDQDINQILKKQ